MLSPTSDILPPPQSPSPKKMRLLAFVAMVVLSLIFIMIYRHYSTGEWPTEGGAYDQRTLQPRQGLIQTIKNFIFHSNNILEGQNSDRINILLLGIGGAGHDGPYLSDTNIIVSIKPSEKEVAMISIPRDLAVNIPENGIRKINFVDHVGEMKQAGAGGEYAREFFAKNFQIEIPYYIRVDFKAFSEMIDAVGGISLNVPRSFSDTMFPGENYSYRTVSFEAGQQTMNGTTALDYARSRHGNNSEGSDFARSRRQQLVLSALKEKLLSYGTYTNPVTLQKIYQSISAHVNTNLNFGQIMYLAGLSKEINSEIKNLVLDSSPNGFLISTTGESGAFLLVPKSGNMNDINQAIKNVFSEMLPATTTSTKISTVIVPNNSTPRLTAKIEIQNGTWRAGLAGRIKQKLETSGFSIINYGNAIKRPTDKTTIYILNTQTDPIAIDNLARELVATKSNTLPDWLTPDYDNPATPDDERGMKYNKDADILVILGTDIKE